MNALRYLFFPAIALLASCGDANQAPDNHHEPSVAVVNYPLAYFVERLLGDQVTIHFDAPADEDPAFWQPGDAEIARMQTADVILMNGASYAKWAGKVSLPAGKLVNTSAGFEDRFIESADVVTHAHGDGGEEHSHGGTAFTTWMDLAQAAMQAEAAAEGLKKAFPDHAGEIGRKLAELKADLESLGESMQAATEKLKGTPVLASHPVYHYWERAYGLKVPSLLWEPEMDLDEEALADLKKLQEENPGAKYFVWEGDPLPEHITKLQELGLKSFVISPCGNRPDEGDFLSVMRKNVAAMQALTE